MKDYREDELIRVMQIVLEKQRFAMESRVNLADAIRRGRLELVPDIIADEAGRMILRLAASVWAQKVQDEEVTLEASFSRSWPASWWQAFKSAYFPAWALRRWPVRLQTSSETQTKRFTFKTVALLPNYRYDPPPDSDGRFVLKSYVTPGELNRFPGLRPPAPPTATEMLELLRRCRAVEQIPEQMVNEYEEKTLKLSAEIEELIERADRTAKP